MIYCFCWCTSDSQQVQCIQSYSSQEPDELSVEMADVLHILECTDDGKKSKKHIDTHTRRPEKSVNVYVVSQ